MSQTSDSLAAAQPGGPPSATRALIERLWREHIRAYWPRIAFALVCMAIVAVSTAGFTQLIKPIINDIFAAKREEMLLPIAMGALVVFTAKGLATYGQSVLMSYVGHRVIADLQTRLYERLIRDDLAFFHQISTGVLVSRFISDVGRLTNAVSTTLTGFGKDLLTALALVGVMFYEDWLLALIAFFAFPLAVLPMSRLGRRMRKASSGSQTQTGRLSTLLDETFSGIRLVKAYHREGYESERARGVIDQVFRLNYKIAYIRSAQHPVMECLGGLAIVAVILYGGHAVITETKDAGSFFAFITALLLAYEPVKRLTKLHINMQEGLAAADRVFALIDREPTIVDRPGATALQVRGGEVRFAGVTFSYDPNSPALHGVDLLVPAGKTVALVGPSGAGKSTVLNLIPRFYDVGEGSVTIDGQDVGTVTLASLHAAVALVSQEILLFDDSLRANIAYGRPDASDADIEAAARHAGAHDFIMALPEGYDTRVGPRGGKLSGGQRQRVSIARAMLKDAPILLLDEATSSLDSESERHVQEALGELMTGRTTLVIAHRLSTVVDADLIYVMDGGRVVESGNHAQLLARGGAYARLYALQFADDDAAASEDAAADLRAHA